MDQFNFKDEKKGTKTKSKSISGFVWSMGALYFFCMAVFLIGYFGMIYLDPQSQYNPFAPSESLPTLVLEATDVLTPDEDVTPEPSAIPVEVFPTATVEIIVPTDVPPVPTEVPIIEPTATEVVIIEPTATVPVETGLFFEAQEGSPVWAEHFSGSCASMYIGGVVIDINGDPMMDVLVQLSGTVGTHPLYDELVFPGQAPQYGESGFEFDLGAPQETTGTAYLLVLDEEGNMISEYLIFPTMGDCSQNLTILNLIQIRE